MKFEKINKDKIKVTLNNDDLLANDIDFQSFMSDSEETQSLFLDVLNKAEKEYDFSTENYRLRVETIALANGNYVMTITRELEKNPLSIDHKKPKANIKIPSFISCPIIYKFENFEDFELFALNVIKDKNINMAKLCKESTLYKYNNSYYIVFDKINVKYVKELKHLFSLIVEFSTYIDLSDVFVSKLHENGTQIFAKNVIQSYKKYFNPEI